MSEQITNPEQLKKNRKVILGIFGIPVLVILFSSVLYYLVDSKVVELGTVNNGELIVPPLPFGEMSLQTLDGKAFSYSGSDPKWAFVVFGGYECRGDCEKMLYIARQSITALAKKMDRVRLIYVTKDENISDELRNRFESEYRGLDVITVPKESIVELFSKASSDPYKPRSFTVVDPRGWAMMQYAADNTNQDTLNTLGKAVVKDMKRLIK